MMLWLVFAMMTAAAIFAALWPLSRRTIAAGGSDIVVYRDQLQEIDRDRTAGLIGVAEADAARVEVSRRLIAAADAAETQAPISETSQLRRRRATAIATLALLPVGVAALYLTIGSPQLPGDPLGPRLAAIHSDRSIDSLIAQVEKHLETNPNDARGYEVLAPVYLRLGRFADAVNARRRIVALEGENAEREADLGEALMVAANGIVTAEAKAAFDRAQALDQKNVKARFFTGLAAAQDGNREKAAEIWRGLLAEAPSGAPWAETVREALAQTGAAPPAVSAPNAANGPSAADIAAASSMSEKDRGDMIRGMVAQLADKLRHDGSDVEGWRRLLRAYMVLGERDKAQAAAGEARQALATDPGKLKQIDEMIKSLGLDG
jgi:cytochrome c-type biogenesis protein CcmH